ncbi:MAG: hypothetical protein AB1486_25625 [Planctomycetota bacterium]
MRWPAALLIAIACAARSGAGLQEAQAPPPDPVAAARQVLDAARRGQGGRQLGARITSMDAELLLKVRDEKGRQNVLEVHRQYRSDGLMVTDIKDETTGAVSREGTDGKIFWLADRHAITRYETAEFEDEKARILEQLELMGLLSRIVLVSGLTSELRDLRRLEDSSGMNLECRVVEGSATWPIAGKTQEVTVRIWVQKETDFVLGVRLTPAEGKPLQICFWFHERNEQEILVPGSIKVYEGKEGEDQVLKAEMAISRILLNTPLPDTRFEPAKPK